MKISRTWAMPNKNTFTIKPVYELIQRILSEIKPYSNLIDPFVGNSPFKDKMSITNDLNPNIISHHHLDSYEFLKTLKNDFCSLVLFDPPYSPRQISESYKSIGREVHMTDTQSSWYGKQKKILNYKVKKNGIVISCGWNSGGMGKENGFEIEEILLVPHGGAHNDTIIVVDRKL